MKQYRLENLGQIVCFQIFFQYWGTIHIFFDYPWIFGAVKTFPAYKKSSVSPCYFMSDYTFYYKVVFSPITLQFCNQIISFNFQLLYFFVKFVNSLLMAKLNMDSIFFFFFAFSALIQIFCVSNSVFLGFFCNIAISWRFEAFFWELKRLHTKKKNQNKYWIKWWIEEMGNHTFGSFTKLSHFLIAASNSFPRPFFAYFSLFSK